LKLFHIAALVFLCFAPSAVCADPVPLISPLATARPVLARHGMVVTQEAAASRVGLDILKRGGNAVDAAVAVGFALAVTLPRAGNLGGGGFMLIHRADLGRTVAIDYREAAPAATTKDVFLDANGKADPFKSRYSGLAIGVPGTVAGFELAWRKYGSGRFSFADLIAPAIALARQGLTVDNGLADSLPLAAAALARHPSSAHIYLRPDGSVPQTGDRLELDDLATTLETIGDRGPQASTLGRWRRRSPLRSRLRADA
jgi:gamma-glutamyltranspeptidase / glutathione hydrolase